MTVDQRDPADAGSDAAGAETISVGSVVAVVALVVGGVLLAQIVARLGEVLGLVVVAGVVAVTTAPFERWLSRRTHPIVGVVITAVLSLGLVGSLAVFVSTDLNSQLIAFSEAVEARLDAIPVGSFWHAVANSVRFGPTLRSWLDSLPEQVFYGSEDASGIGRAGVFVVTVIVLAAFWQRSGPALLDAVVTAWPRPQRQQVRQWIADVDRRGLGYFRRSVCVAVATGAVAAGLSDAFGTSGPLILGAWCGVWFTLPAYGWVVGLAPVAVMAAVQPDERTIGLAASLGVLAAVVAFLRRRWLEPSTVRLGVGPVTVALALGTATGGFDGAIAAVCVASAALVALRSEHNPGALPPWTVPTRQVALLGRLRIPLGLPGLITAASAIVTGVVIWGLVAAIGTSIVWVLVGGFVAIAFSRPLRWLQLKTSLNRAAAVLLLGVGTLTVAGFAVSSIATEGPQATDDAVSELPDVVDDLERVELVGPWLQNREAATWVADQMQDLPNRLSNTDAETSWLPELGNRAVDAFWITLLTLAFLLDGPRLTAGLLDLLPARWRRQAAALVEVTGDTLVNYAAGAALIAMINGVVIFAIATALGLELAPFLALWAFSWNFVPQIGGFVGGVPLLVMALLAGPTPLLLAGSAFLVYQVVENVVIQPTVIGTAIDIPPWMALLGAIAGGAAAGVVGAVLFTPLVGLTRLAWRAYRDESFPGRTAQAKPPPPDTNSATPAAP